MTDFNNDYDKVEKIIETLTDGVGAIVEPFAKRNEDYDSLPEFSYSDTPPDNDGGVVYNDLDDYDSDEEYEYIDGEYRKKDE